VIRLRNIMALGGLAIALLPGGSLAAKGGQSSEVAAVHSADGAWIKAYNGGQVADVVALYEENSVIYPPGAPPVHGRAAIQEFFTKDMAEFAKTGFVLALNPNPDGGVSKDMSWSSGTWVLKDKAGQVIDTGWYFSVSRKVGGKWLYVRDSWNSDKPATASAATEK